MINFDIVKIVIDLLSAVVLVILYLIFCWRDKKNSMIFFNTSIMLFICHYVTEAAEITAFPTFMIDIYTEMTSIFYISALTFLCLYMTTAVQEKINSREYTTSISKSISTQTSLKIAEYMFNVTLYTLLLHLFCIVSFNLILKDLFIPTITFSLSATVMSMFIVLVLSCLVRRKSDYVVLMLFLAIAVIYFTVYILVEDSLLWVFVKNDDISIMVEHVFKTIYAALKVTCLSVLSLFCVKIWRKHYV